MNSSEVDDWFSATELSLLGEQTVAGLPTTMQGCKWRAKKESWVFREVKGSGGPGGVRTEYQPPADVLLQVRAFLEANPEFFKTKRKARAASQETVPAPQSAMNEPRMAYMAGVGGVNEAQSGEAIDEVLLDSCHAACRRVYGGDFDGAAMSVQLGYAVDLYNLLVKMSAQKGGLSEMKRLEVNGLVDQLNVFIRLGWPRKFPPPPIAPWAF